MWDVVACEQACVLGVLVRSRRQSFVAGEEVAELVKFHDGQLGPRVCCSGTLDDQSVKGFVGCDLLMACFGQPFGQSHGAVVLALDCAAWGPEVATINGCAGRDAFAWHGVGQVVAHQAFKC